MLHKLAKTARPASANVGAMKYARLALVACLVACGGGSSGGGGATVDSGTHDGPPASIDAPVGKYDFVCGNTPACFLDKVCCVDPSGPSFSCVDPTTCNAADKLTCDGPQDCMNGDVCCGVDVPNGTGTFPTCGQTSISATCMATSACKTAVNQNCNDASKVQLCHTNADCKTESGNDSCCTFAANNASLSFCFDSFQGGLAGGTCQ
jgi:hypothetical protein